jgi:hypothetical protein
MGTPQHKVLTMSRMLILAVWAAFSLRLDAASLAVVPDSEPQRVFAGEGRTVRVVLQNPGTNAVNFNARTVLYQASSATAIRLTDTPWKRLEVLPGQTVIESATVSFPTVKSPTRFVVRWAEGTNGIFGTTDVLVYPTNLLKELDVLTEGKLGVFDPQNQLKPLLAAAGVEFVNLEDVSGESFGGKLAVFGPFESKTQTRDSMARQIKALAKKHTAVVYIQPAATPGEKLQPSFFVTPENQIIVQPALVADLAHSPASQLNLIRFCTLAVRPEPFALPFSSPEP